MRRGHGCPASPGCMLQSTTVVSPRVSAQVWMPWAHLIVGEAQFRTMMAFLWENMYEPCSFGPPAPPLYPTGVPRCCPIYRHQLNFALCPVLSSTDEWGQLQLQHTHQLQLHTHVQQEVLLPCTSSTCACLPSRTDTGLRW